MSRGLLTKLPRLTAPVGAFTNELPKSIRDTVLPFKLVTKTRQVPLSLMGQIPVGPFRLPRLPRLTPVGAELKSAPKLNLVTVLLRKLIVRPYPLFEASWNKH